MWFFYMIWTITAVLTMFNTVLLIAIANFLIKNINKLKKVQNTTGLVDIDTSQVPYYQAALGKFDDNFKERL